MAKPPQHPLRTFTQPAEYRRRCQANIDSVGLFATFRNDRRPEAHAMTSPTTLQDFEAIELQGEETTIFLRRSGSGPAAFVARVSADAFDVAVGGAFAGSPVHGDLCRSSWLWPQRLSPLCSRPCALCEAGHGERHGLCHGETGIPALLSRRASSGRSCRVPSWARSPGASGASGSP